MKQYYECKKKVHFSSLKQTLESGEVFYVEEGNVYSPSGVSVPVSLEFDILKRNGFVVPTDKTKSEKSLQKTDEGLYGLYVVKENENEIIDLPETEQQTKKEVEDVKKKVGKEGEYGMTVIENVDDLPVSVVPLEGVAPSENEGAAKSSVSQKANPQPAKSVGPSGVKKLTAEEKAKAKAAADAKKQERIAAVKKMEEAKKQQEKKG